MGLIQLIILLAVVGVALYLLNAFLPMDERVKSLINVLVLVALAVIVIIFLLRLGGLAGGGPGVVGPAL